MMAMLRAVEALHLPDAWIGAGFVRNAVWDVLHRRTPDVEGLADIDVVYFDTIDISPERECAIEQTLGGGAWSVRNQACMHLRNGDAPYRDTADAVAHWLETATAVAVRTRKGVVELLAPYGVEDLLGLVVRPTPIAAARPEKMDQFRQRAQEKRWMERWPKLRLTHSAAPACETEQHQPGSEHHECCWLGH